MSIYRLGTFLFLILFLSSSSCKKEVCDDITNPTCPNYDPCHYAYETTAYFTITENTQGITYLRDAWYLPIDSDTVYSTSLTFSAVEEYGRYTWIIGVDTFHEKSVSLWGFPKEAATEVTLWVERTPNTDCFPNDDGIAQLTRSFYQRGPYCDANIVGKYRVHTKTNPEEEFEFELLVCTEPGPPYYGSHYLINLDGSGCTKPVSTVLRTNYEYVFNASSVQCGSPIGRIYMYPSNPEEVFIEFAYQYGDLKGDTLRLQGIKL